MIKSFLTFVCVHVKHWWYPLSWVALSPPQALALPPSSLQPVQHLFHHSSSSQSTAYHGDMQIPTKMAIINSNHFLKFGTIKCYYNNNNIVEIIVGKRMHKGSWYFPTDTQYMVEAYYCRIERHLSLVPG